MLNSGEEIWDEMESAPDPHYIESALSNFQTEVNFAIEYLINLLLWVNHWLSGQSIPWFYTLCLQAKPNYEVPETYDFNAASFFQMLQDYRQTRMENMRQQMQQEIESRVNELNAAIAGKAVGLATNSIYSVFFLKKNHPSKSMTLLWPVWRPQDTVENNWCKPWLCVCRKHFFTIL